MPGRAGACWLSRRVGFIAVESTVAHQLSRAPIQRLADVVSGRFVPAVIVIAILAFVACCYRRSLPPLPWRSAASAWALTRFGSVHRISTRVDAPEIGRGGTVSSIQKLAPQLIWQASAGDASVYLRAIGSDGIPALEPLVREDVSSRSAKDAGGGLSVLVPLQSTFRGRSHHASQRNDPHPSRREGKHR